MGNTENITKQRPLITVRQVDSRLSPIANVLLGVLFFDIASLQDTGNTACIQGLYIMRL